MLSVYPTSSLPLASSYQSKHCPQPAPDLRDAVEPFTKEIIRSRKSGTKLLCTIPTLGSTDGSYWDFNDLHTKRSQLLVLIHELVKSLRTAGVHATYSLVPSESTQCVVCALPSDTYPVNQPVISEVEKVRPTNSTGVSFVECPTGPCLVLN